MSCESSVIRFRSSVDHSLWGEPRFGWRDDMRRPRKRLIDLRHARRNDRVEPRLRGIGLRLELPEAQHLSRCRRQERMW